MGTIFPPHNPSSMLSLIIACSIPAVFGHGGMIWPPSWQNSLQNPLENVSSNVIAFHPAVRDPTTGMEIFSTKDFLTDSTFISGQGIEYAGLGENTHKNCNKKMMSPWCSPGIAPSLGGGCGLFRGDQVDCSIEDCTSKPRKVFNQGSSALDIEFPDAATTEWGLGSVQDVAWVSKGGHRGGYTYRLWKRPEEGKTGITEECFTQNVLKFATPFTMIRDLAQPGEAWRKVPQEDLSEGTYPAGSAWRPIGKAIQKKGEGDGFIRQDTISVPSDLAEGEYVLSLRWDTNAPQIWVSCANIRLVLSA